MMNISIKGIKMPVTDVIRDTTHKKLESLEKLLHHSSYVHAELGKPSSHHRGGPDVFRAELTVDSNGHTYFAAASDSDLYKALDRATLEISEIIKQGKGRRQTLFRKGRMALKQLMKRGV